MKGKIYFASDFHLGMPDPVSSLEREKRVVRWLEHVRHDAQEIYLLGDIFDFWFEYKRAIPKGHTRLLGKLAELTDAGIPVTLFTGNHDMWMFGYLEEELHIPVHQAPLTKTWNGKKFLLGHGDGLGPHDKGYKVLKRIFRNRFCQWLFRNLHPDTGIPLARLWSRKSRKSSHNDTFLGKADEWLYQYALQRLQKEHFDYFIFGHRHLPIDLSLKDNSCYINLGDWIKYFSYAVFDGKDVKLKFFESRHEAITDQNISEKVPVVEN